MYTQNSGRSTPRARPEGRLAHGASRGAAERVAVGIVLHDSRVVVGRRTRPPLAGYAEFPGGRARPGESLEQAVVREVREETGLLVRPERLLLQRRFAYPHAVVDLGFFACAVSDDAATPRPPFRWLAIGEVQRLRFPPANACVLERLRA